ncbi:MAG: hypothetical protein HY235_07160, partial [Acidobacteria bacterium]|nr:hypothetical protein [Acidobacteriota bacterium]
MNLLLDLLAKHNEDVPMDVAALELARIEFPDLEIDPWIALLDSYASELGERVSSNDDGPTYILTANRYLFDELGFRGNDGDYYSPMNSCL